MKTLRERLSDDQWLLEQAAHCLAGMLIGASVGVLASLAGGDKLAP